MSRHCVQPNRFRSSPSWPPTRGDPRGPDLAKAKYTEASSAAGRVRRRRDSPCVRPVAGGRVWAALTMGPHGG